MAKNVTRPPRPTTDPDEKLTEDQKSVMEKLHINFNGCSEKHNFNKMITNCVEFWKSEEWKEKEKHKETGLLYETRVSPNSGKTAIRFTSSIPNCTSGALEALLFDDFEGKDDPKTANIYKFDSLLQMQFNIEEFGPNIIANKTTYKSPVFVVSSRQMVIYLTYAILLDPKQQEELGVRPKSATGLDDGLNVVMQCGIEYTGKSDLAKADKGYERGHTYIYFIMGQEEKDGSLTFTLCMDADPAGSIPKSFADRANAEQYKKAVTMHNLIAKLAKDEKNKAHRIKQFDNDRLFQPMV